MAQAVIEEDAHYVANLRTGRTRQRQRSQPELDFPCSNVSQCVAAPSRNDPLAQVASIAQLGGVRFPSIVGGALALTIVICQLRQGNRLSLAPYACHVDVTAQR